MRYPCRTWSWLSAESCLTCCLQWEEALNNFKAKLAGGGDVFGPLIHKYLLNNQHRVTVVMLPDQKLASKVEEDERNKLDGIRAKMTEQDVRGSW